MPPEPTIFVINLPDRTDRRREMQAELSRIGWRANFFPAIRPSDAASFPSVGARGCYLSHLGVLKDAHKAGVQRLVVLEDDVNFINGFSDHWRRAVAELEAHTWSLFYASHILDKLRAGLSRLPSTVGVQCTHFAMFHGDSLPAFIQGLETILSRPPGHPLGGPMHVDGAYSTIRGQDESLITYAYNPALGYQRASRTDIGEVRWFDKSPSLRPLLRLARKLKGSQKI